MYILEVCHSIFVDLSVESGNLFTIKFFFHFNIYVEHVFTRRGKKLEASDCSYWSLKTGLAAQHQQPIFTYLKLASQSHSGWQESRHQQTHSLSVPILSWLDYRLFAWSHATAASCIDHRWWLAAGERPAASAASAPVMVRIPLPPLLSPLHFLSTQIFQLLPDLEGIRGLDRLDGNLFGDTWGPEHPHQSVLGGGGGVLAPAAHLSFCSYHGKGKLKLLPKATKISLNRIKGSTIFHFVETVTEFAWEQTYPEMPDW